MDRDVIYTKVKDEVEALAGCEIEDPDEEIFSSGKLDSVNILNIITFIETEFNLTVDPFDVNLEMLGTLNKICDYLLGRTRK